MELSKTDRGIIETLQKNARASNRAVAQVSGISEETVRRRTHTMVEAGVIHFGIKVSAAAMGYSVSAMLTVQTRVRSPSGYPFDSVAVWNAIRRDALQVDSISRTIDQRLVIVVVAENIEAINDQVKDIRLVEGVEDVSVVIFHNEGDWYI